MNMLIPVGLYLLALVIRLLVANEMPFPTTEPSAYYVGVAQNLVTGQGLVSDGVWSYATPPLAGAQAGLRAVAADEHLRVGCGYVAAGHLVLGRPGRRRAARSRGGAAGLGHRA